MWTQENLNRVSEILKCSGEANWPRLCSELNIRSGMPEHIIVSAKFGNRAVADEYEFRSIPMHNKEKDTVVVENPWFNTVHSSTRRMHDPNCLIFWPYIEIDADMAMKILVLGSVP